MTDTMPYGHLLGRREGLPQVRSMQEGYCPSGSRSPASPAATTTSRAHTLRILVSLPSHPPGPMRGPRSYPRETQGARPRSRRGPGSLPRGATRALGSAGRLLFVVLGPAPAARRLRFPPPAAGRAAPGCTRRGSASGTPPPAVRRRLGARGLGVRGSGTRGSSGCSGCPALPPARSPSPGGASLAGVTGSRRAGTAAGWAPGRRAGALLRTRALMRAPRRGLSPWLPRGRAVRTSPPRCRHRPTRAKPSPSTAPPACRPAPPPAGRPPGSSPG